MATGSGVAVGDGVAVGTSVGVGSSVAMAGGGRVAGMVTGGGKVFVGTAVSESVETAVSTVTDSATGPALIGSPPPQAASKVAKMSKVTIQKVCCDLTIPVF